MIINNKIETSTNKTTLTLQDINLKFSKFEFINIQKNLWYIKVMFIIIKLFINLLP